jgi:hypothetical protein
MLEGIKICYSQWKVWFGLVTSLIMLAVLSSVLYADHRMIYKIDIFILCLFLMFCLNLARFCFYLKRIMSKNKYAVIASHEGLFLDDFGLIPWSSVLSIEHYYISSNADGFVHIKLHDAYFLASNTSWFAKCRLYYFSFWSKNSIFLNFLLETHPIIAVQKLHEFMEQQKNIK